MSERPRPVVFFCHGSRDERWRRPFDQIVEAFRARHPGREAHLAFLELMEPALPPVLDALAGAGHGSIQVVPLFLAPGAHTNVDLPALVTAARTRWPATRIDVAPTLTEAPLITAAIIELAGRPAADDA